MKKISPNLFTTNTHFLNAVGKPVFGECIYTIRLKGKGSENSNYWRESCSTNCHLKAKCKHKLLQTLAKRVNLLTVQTLNIDNIKLYASM